MKCVEELKTCQDLLIYSTNGNYMEGRKSGVSGITGDSGAYLK